MYKCDLCDKEFESHQALGGHKTSVHLSKKCQYCNDEFVTSKINIHEKGCFLNPDNKKYCKNCGELLKGRYEHKFCSRSCSASFNNKRREITKDHKENISESLRREVVEVKKVCPNCDKTFKVDKNRKDQECCSLSCASEYRWEDEDYREKMKRIMSEQRSGSGNPMYGKTPKNTKNYKITSSKSKQEELNLRSTYEVEAVHQLDDNNCVKSFEYEPFCISYQNGERNYIPDFLVEFRDEITKLIEVKPESLKDKWDNPQKINAAEEYVKNKDLIFEVWSEEELSI